MPALLAAYTPTLSLFTPALSLFTPALSLFTPASSPLSSLFTPTLSPSHPTVTSYYCCCRCHCRHHHHHYHRHHHCGHHHQGTCSNQHSSWDGVIVDRNTMWCHAEGICPAVAPVPASLALYTHALLSSHTVITLPWQYDLSCCHCHRHCGHQHQGTVWQQIQPTMCYYDLPTRMPALSPLLKLRSLVSMTCKQYTTCTHSSSAIIGDHMWVLELASATQLSSRESYGVVLQTEDGNGSSSGVEHAHCQ